MKRSSIKSTLLKSEGSLYRIDESPDGMAGWRWVPETKSWTPANIAEAEFWGIEVTPPPEIAAVSPPYP